MVFPRPLRPVTILVASDPIGTTNASRGMPESLWWRATEALCTCSAVYRLLAPFGCSGPNAVTTFTASQSIPMSCSRNTRRNFIMGVLSSDIRMRCTSAFTSSLSRLRVQPPGPGSSEKDDPELTGPTEDLRVLQQRGTPHGIARATEYPDVPQDRGPARLD